MPLTNAERQKRYRDRRKSSGPASALAPAVAQDTPSGGEYVPSLGELLAKDLRERAANI